ncbi:MAG: hypothetical protein HC782_05165 [Gammaproteobacteria bacterium]|nr:hypothetical protein [Gammaproteobacteria bacterium]
MPLLVSARWKSASGCFFFGVNYPFDPACLFVLMQKATMPSAFRLPQLSHALILLIFATVIATTAEAKPLRYATQDEPQTLDPHAANLAVTTRLLSNVYEGLVGRDKDYN